MHHLVRSYIIDSMGAEETLQVATDAATVLAGCIAFEAQAVEQYQSNSDIKLYVLNVCNVLVVNGFAVSTLSDCDIVWRLARVCSDAGYLIDIQPLVASAVSTEEARGTKGDTDRKILATYRSSKLERKLGKYSGAKVKLTQLLKRIDSLRGSTTEPKLILNARVRREIANIEMREGNFTKAQDMLKNIPHNVYNSLTGTTFAVQHLSLRELQAEIDGDMEAMRDIRTKMAADLREDHPYTIRAKSKLALLLGPTEKEQAVSLSREASETSMIRYGALYVGTVNAQVTYARCLLQRGTPVDVLTASQLLLEMAASGIMSHFGEHSSEQLEFRYQCAKSAGMIAVSGSKQKKKAIEDLKTLRSEVSDLLGTKHPSVLRVTATYALLLTESDKKTALSEIEEACKLARDLPTAHRVADRVQDVRNMIVKGITAHEPVTYPGSADWTAYL